jgi:hypothetical protein
VFDAHVRQQFAISVTGIGTTPDGQRACALVILRVVFTASGEVKVDVDTFDLKLVGQWSRAPEHEGHLPGPPSCFWS